ncbi:hypothetical protein [Aquimarina sp. 2304DJ70-9]|uniref:hypothetical protein n=1 Tax=Aquimarina penaris TaxID=3231044 RepID=UPI0034630DE1
MKYIILIIFVLSLFGCNSNKEKWSNSSKSDSTTTVQKELEKIEKNNQNTNSQIAVDFINSYIENNSNLGIIEWTKASPLVTESFKKELENTITKAWEEDPELGLGFDPIFDAQDYPDKGVKLLKFDPKTGYVIVKGIKWNSFNLTLRIITENGKMLVDGSGIINIPEDKRSER